MSQFCDSDVALRLFRFSDVCRHKQTFCDVTIETNLGPLPAHRLVLSAASPVLYRISTSTDHKLPTKLDLSSMDGAAVRTVVDFAYTGKLELEGGNCASVARVATALEMDKIVNVCVSFLQRNVSIESCLTTWQLAQELELVELLLFCDKFFARVTEGEKEELMQMAAFRRLPRVMTELETGGGNEFDAKQFANAAVGVLKVNYNGCLTPYVEEVMRLVGADERYVATQGDNHATLGDNHTPATSPNREWLRGDDSRGTVGPSSAARRLMLEDDVSCVKESEEMTLVDSSHCTSENNWKVLTMLPSTNDVCIGLVVLDGQLAVLCMAVIPVGHDQPLSASPPHLPLSRQSSESSNSVQFLASLHTARCSMGICIHDGDIFAVGGYNRLDCLNTMEIYDHESNSWSVASQMGSRRGRCAAASVNGKIYCFGGSDGQRVLKSAEIYNINKNAWQSIMPMSSPRSRLSCTVLDGCIYAIGGGSCMNYPLRTVEKYNPLTGIWTMAPSLCEPRTDAGVAVVKQNIYVVGGSNRWSSLSSVECFNATLGKWSLVTPMQTPRRGAGVVSLNGKVYVIGGHDSTQSLDSMEIYDPVTQTWLYGSPMSTARANMAAIVLDGLIFAVGGFDGATFLNTMEYFDPGDNKWHLFFSL
ncbi:kelch-like protein diablo [Corticium candelabrum]|uniref:kelch-like protein diablo n=1 Tax=Corticium candelabrum TaxID=121492 RepID=UPI002E26F85E|nr:kelch-like protein diablo [Corticium candelabrum]